MPRSDSAELKEIDGRGKKEEGSAEKSLRAPIRPMNTAGSQLREDILKRLQEFCWKTVDKPLKRYETLALRKGLKR